MTLSIISPWQTDTIMADTFTCAVNTGPLFALAHAAREAQAQCIKLSGTVYANALRTLTPPHGKGAAMQDTRKKKSKGIDALQARIEQDLQGGPAPTYARPVRRKDGTWMAFDAAGNYTAGGGNFGMVVANQNKFGKLPVPIESPEQVLAKVGEQPLTHKGRVRRWRRVQDGVHFVRAGALRALVRKRKKHAGYTISGWAHGARFFATGKNIAKGFFEPLGGAGAAGQSADPAGSAFAEVEPLEGWMQNDAFLGSLRQRDRIMTTTVHRTARHALDKMRKNIISWYTKKAKQILNS